MLEKLRNAILLVVGGLVAVWAISGLVGVVEGGDMEPWAPPGPTLKDLNAVEPRIGIWQPNVGNFPIVLSQPGSYYLGENITGMPGANGIEIAADNVTLDLNGFALIGDTGWTLDGIHVECGESGYERCQNISIYNGTVRDWADDGVDGYYCSSCRYENLVLADNSVRGLEAFESHVVGCDAHGNGGHGIYASSSVVADSSSEYNGALGFYVDDGTISNSRARGNTANGIYALASIVTDCTANVNDGNGIWANLSTVSDCYAMDNVGDGIETYSGSLITGNVAHENRGGEYSAGIHVTGSNNRIEGNDVTRNGIGIDVDGEDNLTIKNWGSNNTYGDYSDVPNNTFGEWFDGHGVIPDDVSPWANLSSFDLP